MALPAGSGTFMLSDYSCGRNGVHNVEAGFSRLCLEKLDLSNTLVCRKTLSFPKPPHRMKQLCCFPHVLEGNGFPGKGKVRNLLGFRPFSSALFRTVPSIRPLSRP